MAKIGEMVESKYLKQSDVHDEMIVTITKVGKANIAREGDTPEYKWMIRFEELPKPMVLNATNIKRLAKACQSDDTDHWIGKRVTLYVDPDVEYAGNIVGGLRFKSQPVGPKPRQQATTQTGAVGDDIPDDIPF